MKHSNVVPADERTRSELNRLRLNHLRQTALHDSLQAFLRIEEILNGQIQESIDFQRTLSDAITMQDESITAANVETLSSTAARIAVQLEKIKEELYTHVRTGYSATKQELDRIKETQ